MKQIERYCKKVRRYEAKKKGVIYLKLGFHLLLGIGNVTIEDLERIRNILIAREALTYLIELLLFEQNPYEAKKIINENKLIQSYFNKYGLKINCVTKNDVDILFKIMKEI